MLNEEYYDRAGILNNVFSFIHIEMYYSCKRERYTLIRESEDLY